MARKTVRPIGFGQIGLKASGTAARRGDFGDNGLGLRRTAAIVNDDLSASLSERKCSGAPDAAGSAGDERGLSCQGVHNRPSSR